jgi:hypothetical protein
MFNLNMKGALHGTEKLLQFKWFPSPFNDQRKLDDAASLVGAKLLSIRMQQIS